VSEAVCDEGALDVGKTFVRVAVGTKRRHFRGIIEAEVFADAEESFGGAKVGVRGSSLGYLFATDSVLLVSKFEAAGEDGLFIYFIQRVVGGDVCRVLIAALDSKRGVAQTEGLGAPGVFRVGVFSRAKEPVEGEDGEVDDMGVDTSMDWVVGFEDSEQVADDGDVGRYIFF
jgi:hypothetical protein